MFVLIYEACPESIHPCNMKNRDIYWRRYKIQERLYIGQWCLSPLQSRHHGTSHSCNHHQLPPCYFFQNLVDGPKSLPFKGNFSFGRGKSDRAPNLGCREVESPEWFDVSQKNCRRCDAWAGTLSSLWWNCQSPVAHSCSLLNHLNRFHRGMFKPNAKFE